MARRNTNPTGKGKARTTSSSPSKSRNPHGANRSAKGVRYAVVGLGHIAQAAVLPAFEHAKKNSRLVALVSDDPTKLKKLGRKYKVELTASYEQYDDLLRSGEIDAVYVALPNSMHAEYAVRAAAAGVHVLCEKPMAMNEAECRKMIDAAERGDVKLMIAYRLHFEEANLKAIEIANSGKIGEIKLFNSVFCMQVKDDNIRVDRELGGGPLYDIGIYCINAARYIFRAEPTEVAAFNVMGHDERFTEVEEGTCAIMRFPGDRVATFTCSFGAADVGYYQVVGTKGDLCVDSAYEYAAEITHMLTVNGKTKEKTFPKRDQFAPELLYFSDCILNNKIPEPDGGEGLADVRIIRALYESARTGKPIRMEQFNVGKRPSMTQEMKVRPVKEPEPIHAEAASR
jgi:predicted dehydrogenase